MGLSDTRGDALGAALAAKDLNQGRDEIAFDLGSCNDDVVALIFCKLDSPKAIVRLAATCKRLHAAETVTVFEEITVRRHETPPLDWLTTNAARIKHLTVDCTDRAMYATRRIHEAVSALGIPYSLPFSSQSFVDILGWCQTKVAPVIPLMAQHRRAVNEDVRQRLDSELGRLGVVANEDVGAAASWSLRDNMFSCMEDRIEAAFDFEWDDEGDTCIIRPRAHDAWGKEFQEVGGIDVRVKEDTADWWLPAVDLFHTLGMLETLFYDCDEEDGWAEEEEEEDEES